jgi:hypothetical protein
MPESSRVFTHGIRFDFTEAFNARAEKTTCCLKSAAAPVGWTKLDAQCSFWQLHGRRGEFFKRFGQLMQLFPMLQVAS